jgi:thiamine-monophosphate kinase
VGPAFGRCLRSTKRGRRVRRGSAIIASRFGLELVGGDTVRGPLVVTVSVFGFVESDGFLTRSGARPGDRVYVSGWPGEAAADLELLLRDREIPGDNELGCRHRYAEPRLALGRALRGCATSAMDVSDGCSPTSRSLRRERRRCDARARDLARVAGARSSLRSRRTGAPRACGRRHDYELVFTLPADWRRKRLQRSAVCPVTRIGTIVSGEGVTCRRTGSVVDIPVQRL